MLRPLRGHEGNGSKGSRPGGGLPASAGSAWSLLDAILDARRGRRRGLAAASSQGQGDDEKADTPGSRANEAIRGARGDASSGGEGGDVVAAGGDNEGTVPGRKGEISEQHGVRSSGGSGERRVETRGGGNTFHYPFHHAEGRERGQHERAAARMKNEDPGSDVVEDRGGRPSSWKDSTNSRATDDDDRLDVPTFKELVQALRVKVFRAPTAFRPAASLCGQNFSQFDVAIPFERLQVCA